jgi:glycosyltransferase involved in cell wall biosynthesis
MSLESRPDLVIAGLPSVEAAEAASLYCQQNHVPFVMDAHDTWPDIYLQVIPRPCRQLAKRLLGIEFARAKRVFRSAAAVTAVSDTYLKWGLGYAGRPRGRWDGVFQLGSLSRRAVEVGEFVTKWRELRDEFRIPDGKFLATFVGTLGNFYDVETIARAAEILELQNRKDIHFVVVGTGDKVLSLAQMSERLGNFTQTGRLPQDRVSVLLLKSGVGISAYTANATQSLPYKLFEYMSAGLPQVCSLDGEARRLLAAARAGVYYRAGDGEQLARLIVKLAERPRLREYMAQKARVAFSGRYEMGVIYPQFARHLEGVANQYRGEHLGRGLRVLYIHQHYSSREGSAGTRSYEHAKALTRAGHHVTVFAGRLEGMVNIGPVRLDGASPSGGVEEFAVYSPPILYSNKMTLRSRALSFMRFAWAACRFAVGDRWDVVIATSTPLTVALPGILHKSLYRDRTFVFEVRDLWPDMLTAFGVKNAPLIRILGILERVAYRYADACIGLSPGMVAAIAARTQGRKTIELIPNGCDLDLFDVRTVNVAEIPGVCAHDFVAMYAGTHGVANGLDALIDLAVEARRVAEQRLKIVLVGDGKDKARLEERKRSLGLENCIFLDPVAKRHLTGLLARADCGLMAFANVPQVYYGTSPNKFFDYISMSKPVIVNYPGWMADLVKEFECGTSVSPSESGSLLRAIQELIDCPEKCRIQGSNARRLAESRFSRSVLSARFVRVITSAARDTTGALR